MTDTQTKDREVVKTLRSIRKMYHHVLEMDYENQQRTVLKIIASKLESVQELAFIPQACKKVLKQYPKGSFPHDSTLLDEVREQIPKPFQKVIPSDFFEEDQIIFHAYMTLITKKFDRIREHPETRHERYIIERLEKIIRNTLVDNPNFKGPNPYYKRYYADFSQSKKLSLNFLDEEFAAFIDYFGEETEKE